MKHTLWNPRSTNLLLSGYEEDDEEKHPGGGKAEGIKIKFRPAGLPLLLQTGQFIIPFGGLGFEGFGLLPQVIVLIFGILNFQFIHLVGTCQFRVPPD